MKTFWDKTPEELSQELQKQSVSEVHKQTVFLLEILKQVGEAIQNNKSVKVENIVRQVVGEVTVKRPEWIAELKHDTKSLEKKLDYIASAIIRKEVVRKIDVNRPEWIKELAQKDIQFPEQKDFSKPTVDTLKLILKAIEEKEGVEEVKIKNAIEIKEPSWFRFPDIGLILNSTYRKLVSFLEDTVFDVRIKNEVDVNVKNKEFSVTVLNQKDEINIKNISKITEKLDLVTAQLRALGSTGSNAAAGAAGGGGGDASEATLQLIHADLDTVETKLQSLIDKAESTSILKKTVALTGSGNVLTPASGKKIRVFNLKFSLSADMTDVAFKFGSGTAFEKYLAPKTGGLYGSNTHPDYNEGAIDEILKCDITGTGTVQINLEYVEV